MPPQQVSQEIETSQPAVSQKKEIYYDGYMYDVTDWMPKHPGGTIIKFYTDPDEDATIPVQQFHQRSFKRVLAIMQKFPKRPATIMETYADKEVKRHQKLTADFQALYKDLTDKGYFEPSPWHTFLRVFEVVFFMSLSAYFALHPEIYMAKALTFIFTIIGVTRAAFLTHEGGHASLTGYPKFDKFLEAILMTLGVGLASTWWSSQHNRHHAMPQRMHRDVDLDTLPILAFNAKVAAKDPKYGNTFFTRHQAKLFFAIDTLLVILVWKIVFIPRYLIRKKQYGQLLVNLCHYVYAFCVLGGWMYFSVMWIASMWIFGTFTMSHTHLPVTTEKLHWVEYSLLHTMDVNPSWWCDWAMGYLNYQIEHHLFPTMPNFRQREMAWRVKKLAKDNGLPYMCTSYAEALTLAFKNLAHVSEEIKSQAKLHDD